MKAIVLVGGYAKRMYPFTKHIPKALLPVIGKPIVNYILEQLHKNTNITEIILSSNERFALHFEEYLKMVPKFNKVKLVIEASTSDENKLGAIGALDVLIDEQKIEEDIFVIAGDNLFDFSLAKMIDSFLIKSEVLVGCYNYDNIEVVRGRYGVLSLNDDNLLTDFEEKPEKPKSSIISTGVYIFPKKSLKLIKEYKENGNNLDAPGFFIQWLIKKQSVYGYIFQGNWYDIGQIEQYSEAIEFFEKKGGLKIISDSE